MNEKQAKLLRYFVTNTGNHAKADEIRKLFDLADHKTKGKITTWLKRVIVTSLKVKQIQERQTAAQLLNNLKTLEGFAQ